MGALRILQRVSQDSLWEESLVSWLSHYFRIVRIEHQRLNFCHGIVHAIVFHEDLSGIQWGERCVERKVQLSLVSCLTIYKSRKLLAVAIAELYLETSAVCLQYFLTRRCHGSGWLDRSQAPTCPSRTWMWSDVRIASLRISSYWLSGSEIIILLKSWSNYKGTENQTLSQIYLVMFC